MSSELITDYKYKFTDHNWVWLKLIGKNWFFPPNFLARYTEIIQGFLQNWFPIKAAPEGIEPVNPRLLVGRATVRPLCSHFLGMFQTYTCFLIR